RGAPHRARARARAASAGAGSSRRVRCRRGRAAGARAQRRSDCRRAAEPARCRGHREHLEVGIALPARHQPLHARQRPRRPSARAALPRGARAAEGECRGTPAPQRLQPRRAAVPQVRDGHLEPQTGARCPSHVLVSALSAVRIGKMLIKGMTAQEIRVLQEFRRVATETLTAEAVRAIKHPTGGGDEPAISLIAKGYLTADDTRTSFTLTPKAKDFLAYDPKPEFEEAGAGAAEVVE